MVFATPTSPRIKRPVTKTSSTPTTSRTGPSESDVLVVIPSGYPGVMLDGAYLPQDSPLLGKVAGQPKQGSIQVDGRIWELVSYHPHNGGGAAPWNPSRNGIHSYYSEVISWIQTAVA